MKRPRKVKVKFQAIERYYAVYTCPFCRVDFMGGNVHHTTVRFLCDCGETLIVEEVE